MDTIWELGSKGSREIFVTKEFSWSASLAWEFFEGLL
jgi:hypothetical protein